MSDESILTSSIIKDKFASFMNDYNEGKYNQLKLEFGDDLKIAGDHDVASEDKAANYIHSYPLSSRLPERLENACDSRPNEVLAISNIPPTMKKSSIESLLRDSCEHFEVLYLSEPVYEKGLYRSGFAIFTDEPDLASLSLKLENVLVQLFRIHLNFLVHFLYARLKAANFITRFKKLLPDNSV